MTTPPEGPPPPAGLPPAPYGGAAPPAPYGGPVPPGGWHQPPPAQVRGELAGWWSRVAAALVDGIIVGVPALVLLGAVGLGFLAGDDDPGIGALIAAGIASVLVVGLVALVYAPLTMKREGAANGQTFGKQLCGIRVVRDDGQPIDFWFAALREVAVKAIGAGVASNFTFGLAPLLDVLWPLWDDQNRALHDMIVSTHVVKT